MFAFSASFLLFSLLFLSFMVAAHPDSGGTAALQEPGDFSEAYVTGKEDALTVLFMGADGKEAVPGIFLLIKFDPAGGKVPVLALPPEAGVLNNGRMEPVGEVYSYGGAGYTKDILAAQLGITVDRYVRMDRAAFIAAADAVGSVEFELRQDMVLREDGAELSLRAGRQLLDGRKAALILSSEAPGESRLERAGRLTAEIVNQRMDIVLTTVMDKVFEKIVNMVDTDISYKDYHDRKQAAEYLAESGGEPAYALAVTGEWNGDKTVLILSDTFLALTAREFG